MFQPQILLLHYFKMSKITLVFEICQWFFSLFYTCFFPFLLDREYGTGISGSGKNLGEQCIGFDTSL